MVLDPRLVRVYNLVKPGVPVPTIISTVDLQAGQARLREIAGLGAFTTYAARFLPQVHADMNEQTAQAVQRSGLATVIFYDEPQYAFQAGAPSPFRSTPEEIQARIDQRLAATGPHPKPNPHYRSYLGAQGPALIDMHSEIFTLQDVRAFTRSDQLAGAGATGKGVTVAVLDTGIDDTHPMLEGQVLKHLSFVPEPAGTDGHGHGTFCASAVAGLPWEYNGHVKALNGRVIQGMAPDARLLDVKVLTSEGAGASSSIIQGVEAAVEEGARILSMSLGSLFGGIGYGPDAQAVDEATKRGVTAVVAAGNSFSHGTIGSPGSAAGAVTVGSVAMRAPVPGAVSSFSCLARGTWVRTPDGARRIEEITPGLLVSSLNEETRRIEVATVVGAKFSGLQKVIRIKVGGKEIRATSNHPFLRLERTGAGRRDFRPVWSRAGELKKGDHVCVALAARAEHGQPWPLPTVEDRGVRTLKVGTHTTPGLMYLFGAYLGDGNKRFRQRDGSRRAIGGEIQYSNPIGDKARYNIIRHAETELGISPRLERNYLHLYSVKAVELFENLGLNGNAHTKRIPSWAFTTSFAERLAMIEGYRDADGYIDGSGGWRFSSCNRDLLEDFRALAITCGLPVTGIYHQKAARPVIKGRVINSSGSWIMVLAPKRNEHKFRGTKRDSFEDLTSDDIGFAMVTSMVEDGEAETYDLHIEPHGNFVANGIIVHNSKGPLISGVIKPTISAPGGNLGVGGAGDETILGASAGVTAAESGEPASLERGTSMATPIVAGILAQLVPLGLPRDRNELEVLLARGTKRGFLFKDNRAGWGIIDAVAAMRALETPASAPVRGWVRAFNLRARPGLGAAGKTLGFIEAKPTSSQGLLRLTLL